MNGCRNCSGSTTGCSMGCQCPCHTGADDDFADVKAMNDELDLFFGKDDDDDTETS